MKLAWLKAEDVPVAMGLLARAFDELGGEQRGERFDPATVRGHLERALLRQSLLCWCAWRRSELVGVAALALVPSLTCSGHLKAVECVWHSDPRLPVVTRGRVMVRLLDVLLRGARSMGAQTVHVGCPPLAPVAQLLKRRGFVGTEMVFMRKV